MSLLLQTRTGVVFMPHTILNRPPRASVNVRPQNKLVSEHIDLSCGRYAGREAVEGIASQIELSLIFNLTS